jgi:uncharacterized membrane protein
MSIVRFIKNSIFTRVAAISLLVLLAAVGLADTVYLVMKSATGGSVVCNVLNGCNTVLNSSWSEIAGLPTAVYGLGYYGLLFVFSLAYLIWRDYLILQLLAVISTVGVLVSLFLVYLQLFVIGAVCEYCMLSALTTVCLCLVVWLLMYRNTKSSNNTS